MDGKPAEAKDSSELRPSLIEPPTKRLMSLDALRGFDMAFIVGGSVILRSFGKAIGRVNIRNRYFVRLLSVDV